jgi:RND family efflux transporter MFP subunit
MLTSQPFQGGKVMTTVSHSKTDSRVRRGFFAIGRIALTATFVAAAIGAGMTGYGMLSARASEAVGPDPAPLTTVATQPLIIVEELTITRRFTGQFEATQDIALGFEEGGTIAEVTVREGDLVARGTVVSRLDTRLLDAERARIAASREALAAQAELARRTNDRQVRLLAEGHVTQQRVDETSLQLAQLDAALVEADAGLAAIDVRLSKAEARAPFDGRIATRMLDAGAVAAPGAAVVTLLEDAPARFRVAIDPDLAETLTPGQPVEITAGDRRFEARLAELSPDLDPATRSRVAFFDLATGVDAPPARSTGEVRLVDARDIAGAWVPVSSLWQGPRGAWTILVAVPGEDAGATIATEAVEVLHLDGARAFVRGSFADGAQFLAGGTHRVVPGEAVRLAEVE